MDVTYPYFLVIGDKPAPEFERADWDSTITRGDATEYVQGDLVYVTSGGKVNRAVAVAASMPKVALAGQDWYQPNLPPADPSAASGATHWFLERGVPLNRIDPDSHVAVFTYKGATADGTAHTFLTADRQLVLAHTQVALKYDSVELCYVLSATTTNPNVEMLHVEMGEVGDDNVRIACRILPAYLR